jgi:hypothetical protein
MKMKLVKSCLAILAAGLLSSGMAVAQQDRAATLDELLEMVRQARIAETAEHRQREEQFRRERANQQNLLNQANATREAEERRSERLEQTYAQQEAQVDAKRRQLQERLGSLRELFGHLTSTAGDLRGVTTNSLVSAQLANRGDFLDEFDETFHVNLSGASNAAVADAQGAATITDDDEPPTVSPRTGEAVPYTRADGEVVRVATELGDGRIRQFFDADDGQKELLFRLRPDGTMAMEVTVFSDRLREPFRYTWVFQKR